MSPSERAAIGTTGLRVTRLGLGGAPLGGLFTPVDEAVAAATVAAAWRTGVRFFDTAPLYGHGRGEARLGQYLREYPREELVLGTKVGRILVPKSAPAPSHYADPWPFDPVFDFSRDAVLRSFESSLKRLDLERIDILHIHDPDDHFESALAEAVPALMELRAQRLIRAVSAGMNQWPMLERFARAADFDCFLLAGRYTLLDQSAARSFLPLCAERGIAVFAGGPYNSGVLAAGSRGPGHYDYAPPSPAVVQRTARLEAVCARHAVPLKAAALQFPLRHAAVVSVIAGARSAQEVEENAAMMSHAIPPELWRDLEAEGLIAAGPEPSD